MSKKVRKTIRMPKATLDLWLHHLRSGKVAQGAGALHDGKGYCCLGVLQCAVTGGKVEQEPGSDDPAYLPSFEWLKAEGIKFKDEGGRVEQFPWLPSIGLHAASANDRGWSFGDIADAIEACAVGY